MSAWVRLVHRWLSAAFTLAVLANLAVMPLGNEELSMAVGGGTLIPLIPLLLTGIYLFVVPYARRTTGGEST